MSFYLNNITTEKMFEDLLQDERVVLVRFGVAEKPECQRLDRLISSLSKEVWNYFLIAAYEKKDVPKTLRKKYSIADGWHNVLIFFYRGKPVYVSFHRKPNFQVTDEIASTNDLLSLLVTVQQGVKHKRKVINVYGLPFEERHRRGSAQKR